MINKLKELTKDTAIYGISTILGRFLTFLLLPLYTQVFTKAEVGVYGNIYSYIAFFNILFIYGMDAAYLKYASISKEGELKKLFSTLSNFILLTSVILSLAIFFFRKEMNSLMDVPDNYFFLINYVILILLLDTLALMPFAHLRIKRQAKKFALIRLANIILNLTLNLVLILKLKFDIEAIFISNLIASLFSFVAVSHVYLKNYIPVVDKQILVKALKFGIPYLPASLAATIVQVIDRPILTKLTDNSTVGIYTANYKLGIFMMLFVQMFQFAWQPFFLENAKEKNAKDIFAKVMLLFISFTSIVWIVLSIFIRDIATFKFGSISILGSNFQSGLVIVPIILLSYIFNGIYVVLTAGIYIEEKTKYMPLITGLGALTNVVSNLILIPQFSIVGAAISTLLSYLVMAASIFVVTNKFYKIEYESIKIAKIFFIMILFMIVIYKFDFLNFTILQEVAIALSFIGSYFALRIVSVNDIKTIINLVRNR